MFLRRQLTKAELQYGFSGYIYTGATNTLCLFRNGLWASDTGGKKPCPVKEGQVYWDLSWESMSGCWPIICGKSCRGVLRASRCLLCPSAESIAA